VNTMSEHEATPSPEVEQVDLAGFFGSTVARPVALAVIFATLILVGFIAYRDIPIRLLPSGYEEPELYVWVPNEGASAKENEEKVARVLEEEMRTMTGIKELYTHSNNSRVFARIELNGNLDLDLAKAEVRDRIERARTRFPDTVMDIGMWSEAADQMPLAFFGVVHSGDPDRTDYLIDKVVKPRLESVEGVSKVDIWGVLQDSIRILLHEDKVEAARLDLGDLIQRLSSDNFAQPMGEMDDGGRRLLLRTDMRFTDLEQIENYPVTESLRVKDLGEVVRVKSVRDSLARTNGSRSYTGMASKESTANAVEASHAFRDALEDIENDPLLAGELSFIPFFVQGDLIENSLAQLQETALWGGVLAVGVLFVFLRRVRMTLCVAASIPVATLLAITWQYFRGESFNVLTMAGVTLALGMLVDNSVVVIENISRYRGMGRNGFEAAREGTREIALAITLATLTTVVVFLPLIFMSENPLVRVIFGGIGLPLCAALLFSLLIALVFLPVIAARIAGPRAPAVERAAVMLAPWMAIPVRCVASVTGAVRWLWFRGLRFAHAANRFFIRILAPIRYLLVLGVAALIAWNVTSSKAPFEAKSKLPDGVDVGPGGLELGALTGQWVVMGVVVVLLALVGLPRWRRRATQPPARPESFVPKGASVVEMLISLNRSLVSWTLKNRLASTALAGGAFFTAFIAQSMLPASAFEGSESFESVSFYVDFDAEFTLAEASEEMSRYEQFVAERKEDWGFENYTCRFDDEDGNVQMYWNEPLTAEIVHGLRQTLREELPKYPGHTVRFFDGNDTEKQSKTRTWFRLRGPDSTELERIGEEAIAVLREVPGLINVTSPLEDAPEQLEVNIDRDLALSMGVNTEVAQNSIAWALRGWSLPQIHEEGREVPFLIEYDQERAAGMGTLRDLSIWSPASGARVPLASFADIGVAKGRSSIRRYDGQTTFTVQAEIKDPSRYMEVNDAANAALAQLELPRGYSVGFDESARARQEDEFAELQAAFGLSIVLVFLLMGILFESVLLPFSVLFTIPFAFLGAMWTLLLTGVTLDFMGWIGMIILAGVVVNNGIVLIDRIHRLARGGMPRDEAVVLGCGQRVRPILMTALTTIFGLLPMALSSPATDSISYKVLAIVVAGGLLTSTFFTLWVVPLAYTVLDDLSKLISTRMGWWLRRPRRATPTEPAVQA